MTASCLPCAIIAGETRPPGGLIFAGDHWLVSHVVPPVVVNGMLIIKTRRHCESLAELTFDECTSLGPIIQRTCAALQSELHPERIYVCSFGESVRHVHFFVIPRVAGQPVGSWAMFTWIRLRRFLIRAGLLQAVDLDGVTQLCTRLATHFPG